MKIICISGKAGHGKDTAAVILKTYLQASGYSVLITHYADLLKFICTSYFGWNGKKDEAGRGLLQHVGTDVIRKNDPDFWVDWIIYILKMFPRWDYVLIPDLRFPNEFTRLTESGFDAIHVRISRQAFLGNLNDTQKSHASETALDGFPADYTIQNTGSMEDLKHTVTQWIQEVCYES